MSFILWISFITIVLSMNEVIAEETSIKQDKDIGPDLKEVHFEKQKEIKK